MRRILCLIPFILGAVCLILYSVIGSYVDLDGMLIEPFFLIPIGFFWIVVGGLVISFGHIRHLVNKKY